MLYLVQLSDVSLSSFVTENFLTKRKLVSFLEAGHKEVLHWLQISCIDPHVLKNLQ